MGRKMDEMLEERMDFRWELLKGTKTGRWLDMKTVGSMGNLLVLMLGSRLKVLLMVRLMATMWATWLAHW